MNASIIHIHQLNALARINDDEGTTEWEQHRKSKLNVHKHKQTTQSTKNTALNSGNINSQVIKPGNASYAIITLVLDTTPEDGMKNMPKPVAKQNVLRLETISRELL
jgi:hypothetical protein